jgi:signal peptidase S26 family
MSDVNPYQAPPSAPETGGESASHNRDNSNDSRVWGTVDARLVKGVAAMVWWSRDPEEGTIRWARMGQPIR